MEIGLSPEDIQNTVDLENLVVRNLQVTQGYYRISRGMRYLIGSKNVSWCSFATHASKTAGQALRHELMPRILKSAILRLAGYENTFFYLNDILGDPGQAITSENDSPLADALKRVSTLVSTGNIMVYAELAPPFVELINEFARDWKYDEGKIEAFAAKHFKPGPLEKDGQDYVKEAFTAYYRARFLTNSKEKAEYVLLGNLLIGLHEQTRLQHVIEQALSIPYDVFVEGRLPGRGGKRDQQENIGRARKLVTRATTQMLMSITLPSRELKLNVNVIAPTGVISFPSDLLSIENPRCLELVRGFETRADTLSGSAAENWVSLKDRMSFVVDFFRSHQQYKRLFEPPFLENQVPTIDSGRFPAGPL